MNRIDATFKELRAAKKKAFIAFITAGYPDLATTERLVLSFAKAGVDIVELGIPFSDPIADGPVIQEASQAALEKNMTLAKAFGLVKKIRRQTDIPLCFMSYYNPILSMGHLRFLRQARLCGVDGVIIPDLPAEEAKGLARQAASAGIEIIRFISPTTSRIRLRSIARIAQGFIYYISVTGVTGTRKDLAVNLRRKLAPIKKITDTPVCVGFGVSTARQVNEVLHVADGVIVGSAIVRKIKENLRKPDLVRKVSRFVAQLKKD